MMAFGTRCRRPEGGGGRAWPPEVREWVAVFAVVAGLSCGPSDDGDASEGGTGTDSDGDGPSESAIITHEFGPRTLGPLEEQASTCVSWTLANEQAIYVQKVTLSNLGTFHHSNWFVVPEDKFPGEDGYWSCADREFNEIGAATSGTVLFAQSTQSWTEAQQLTDGAVIKIPPRHKIVAGVHLLNLAPREHRTNLWLSLELIHPRDVDVVLAPFRMSYVDLKIPPMAESRFTSRCEFGPAYEGRTGEPFDLRLYWVLPHYHYLGNYFSLRARGGPLDGDTLFELEGFNAEGNGKRFDPPLDLTGTEGLEFTCGYDNWRDQEVGWGVGDQEMCVMLGLADARALLDGSAQSGTRAVDSQDGILFFEADCFTIALPKNTSQGMPTTKEQEGELYVPPIDDGDIDVPPVPECRSIDLTAEPEAPVTLSSIRDTIFAPNCSFSSCHGSASAAAAGLHLGAPSLHAELLGHEVAAETSMPLVAPGDPENSWLYRLISRCEPENDAGEVVSHMPRNAPVLLDPPLVAKVRAWIEAGAPDD